MPGWRDSAKSYMMDGQDPFVINENHENTARALTIIISSSISISIITITITIIAIIAIIINIIIVRFGVPNGSRTPLGVS